MGLPGVSESLGLWFSSSHDVDSLVPSSGGWELRIVLPVLALKLVSLSGSALLMPCLWWAVCRWVCTYWSSNAGPLVDRACDGVLASQRHTCVFSFPAPSCSGPYLCVPPLRLLLLTVESGCYLSSSSCSLPALHLQRVSLGPQALQPAHSAAPSAGTCPVSGSRGVTLSYPHFAFSS